MTQEKVMEVEAWTRLVDNSAETISRIIAAAHRIAVIGIKTADAGGPAYSVPAAMQRAGFEIVPVPVYFPDVVEILGQPVHRSLATIVPPADLIQLFRRPADIPAHVEEILAAKPRVVWMQQGIRHDAVAEQLARAGITVVQDRCFLVEQRRRGL